MNKLQAIAQKIIPYVMKFANAKAVVAVKDGILYTMPVTLIGSIFLLIANIPLANWTNIMTKVFGENWAVPLNQIVGSTFDIIAIIAAFGIAYTYAKNEKVDGVSAGVISIVTLMILTKASVVTASGEVVTGVIPKVWTGGQGMIASIIVGLVVGWIYSLFITKNIRIKMPDGVPEGVSNAFTALIPGLVIMTGAMIIFIVCDRFFDLSFIEALYKVLQSPMQMLTDSLPALLLILFLQSFFWSLGIHGNAVVMAIMLPILQANSLANQAILDAGQTLIVGENAKIVTVQIVENIVKMGGSGMTIGLVICMLLWSRSSNLKQLGKMAVVPSLFNINEPIIFGCPLILNPIMFVPFTLVPMLSGLIVYGATMIGFIPTFAGAQIPWTTPPLISGFILAGWKGLVLEIGLIIMAVAIYYPFFKMQDKTLLDSELSNS